MSDVDRLIAAEMIARLALSATTDSQREHVMELMERYRDVILGRIANPPVDR